jgi:FkbH-like protein
LLFELDKYDKKLHSLKPATPELPYEVARNIRKTSLIYWAEHCVECAAPSCYQSCDLYQPRTDVRCRRFTFGAFKNQNFHSKRGYGVEIAFKKWAKISAYANLRLSSPTRVLWSERLIEWTAPFANVFGKLMARATKKIRWNAVTHEGLEALVRKLHSEKGSGPIPDAFLLEIYNPTDQEIRMQLNFYPVADKTESSNGFVQLALGFTTTIHCPLGYARHEIDAALFRGMIEKGRAFEISMIPEADSDARLVFLSADFVQFEKVATENSQTKNVKCVVFDLDNTLWQGVLVEGDDVTVPPQRVTLLKQLDERGILLSVASKNDHESAWKKLEELGLSEYFLYPQINWNSKSQSVKTIAKRLNIGIDAIAFVDDNPFELDEVGKSCPEVVCIGARKIESLAADPRFQGSSTPDARRRRQLYKDSETRELAQESFGSDYLGFLESCEINLEISPYTPEQYQRVAELVQRTNQLNFSGHKHTREELEALLADPTKEKLVLKCSDRYGAYGTVGFCVVEAGQDAIRVWDMMLSCRVQGKLIEKVLFDHLMKEHNAHAAENLWVNFHPTQRNQPAQKTLESLNFQRCAGGEDTFSHGMICKSPESLRCEIIRVNWTDSLQEVETQAAR